MQPYGTYGASVSHFMKPEDMDVTEMEDSLSHGLRIRNKKAKRRFHKKIERQRGIKQSRQIDD